MRLGERFVFEVESVETEGAKVPGKILLSWYRPLGHITDPETTFAGVKPGERWSFTVRMRKPHENSSPISCTSPNKIKHLTKLFTVLLFVARGFCGDSLRDPSS